MAATEDRLEVQQYGPVRSIAICRSVPGGKKNAVATADPSHTTAALRSTSTRPRPEDDLVIQLAQKQSEVPRFMHYTRLGASNLRVSRIALGTMTFGFRTSEDEAHAILDRAGDMGINLIDTSFDYGAAWGETERIIGS